MANLVTDSAGRPAPQYLSEDGTHYEYQQGTGGALNVNLRGITPKGATETVNTKVLPVQVVDNTGNIVSTFVPTVKKTELVVLATESRTGTTTSEVVDTSGKSNLSIILYKAVGDANIDSITVEGLYGGNYLPLATTTDLVIPVGGTYVISLMGSQIVLPNFVRVTVVTNTATTYAVYATLS